MCDFALNACKKKVWGYGIISWEMYTCRVPFLGIVKEGGAGSAVPEKMKELQPEEIFAELDSKVWAVLFFISAVRIFISASKDTANIKYIDKEGKEIHFERELYRDFPQTLKVLYHFAAFEVLLSNNAGRPASLCPPFPPPPSFSVSPPPLQ